MMNILLIFHLTISMTVAFQFDFYSLTERNNATFNTDEKSKAPVQKKGSLDLFYLRKDYNLMVAFSLNRKVGFFKCGVYGDRNVIKNKITKYPYASLRVFHTYKMNTLVQSCNELNLKKAPLQAVRQRKSDTVSQVTSWIDPLSIFPGTKYCGPGDISSRSKRVKVRFGDTDDCCRKRGNCYMFKPGTESIILKDTNLLNKPSCKCDAIFRKCLRKTGSIFSDMMGIIYFDVVKVQCLLHEYPIVGCKKNRVNSAGDKICTVPKLNKTEGKFWQVFDSPSYFADIPDGKNVH